MLGGAKEKTPTSEHEELGKLAVSEHNSKQNEPNGVTFGKVVSVKQQVVAGIMYHLVLEATAGGEKKQYAAKVWAKPGAGGEKALERFEPV